MSRWGGRFRVDKPPRDSLSSDRLSADAVAVVLVNYNGLDDTRACLRSLAASGAGARAIVVDNGSRGGEDEAIRREFPDALVIQSGADLGYAGGANLGIAAARRAGARHVLLLNNDTVVLPGFLEPLVAAADADPRVGIVTGKILTFDEPPRIWAAGAALKRFRGLGLNRGEGEPDRAQYDAPGDVAGASLCLALVPLSVFDRVGPLDDRYFLYLEDVDFSLRVRRAGLAIRYEPRAVVRHRVQASAVAGGTKGTSDVALYYLTRNRPLFMRAHMGPLVRAVFYAHYVTTRALKTLGALARGRWGRAWLLAAGTIDGLLGRTGMGRIA